MSRSGHTHGAEDAGAGAERFLVGVLAGHDELGREHDRVQRVPEVVAPDAHELLLELRAAREVLGLPLPLRDFRLGRARERGVRGLGDAPELLLARHHPHDGGAHDHEERDAEAVAQVDRAGAWARGGTSPRQTH
jgi:hypothetical protein